MHCPVVNIGRHRLNLNTAWAVARVPLSFLLVTDVMLGASLDTSRLNSLDGVTEEHTGKVRVGREAYSPKGVNISMKSEQANISTYD